MSMNNSGRPAEGPLDAGSPDSIITKGMFYSISITQPDPPPEGKQFSGPTPPTYKLVVNDVDRLIRAILDTSGVNADYCLGLVGADARRLVERENPSFLPRSA